VAGGVDGLGHAVVLAGLPDDWIPVVLAAIMDGHPYPEGQGGFPVMDGLAAVVAALVSGHSVVGILPVEGAFGVPDRVALEVRVGVAELGGQAAVVVAVAGDLVRPPPPPDPDPVG
jgi:hypothetical protein